MQAIVRRRPGFVLKGGKYVRNTAGREVEVRSVVKGDSLAKFPRSIGMIGFHKWS